MRASSHAESGEGLIVARQPAPQTAESPTQHTDPVITRMVDRSPAIGEQATLLNHMSATSPARVGPMIQHMQRTYGNAHVTRSAMLARQAGGDGTFAAEPEIESAIEQARGSGQALDHHTRSRMERSFSADFSAVRVHTDATANQLSDALSAHAFTVGSHIFFRGDAYAPGTSNGRELLAHELTHVVQQTGPQPRLKLTVSEPGDRYEQEADRMARAVMQSEHQPADNRADRMGADRAESTIQRAPLTPGERALAGAGTGAVVGAGIGALFGGPVGAVVGAGIGALVGAGIGYFAGLRVGVPGHIRAASTPRDMAADRIPPRIDTPVAVSIAGLDPSGPPVTLSIDGANASNGTVTIDGAATKDLRASATVQLRGTVQTTPGSAGNLRLIAKQGGTEFDRSSGFSVAAIPQNWSVALLSLVTEATDPGRRGMRVTNSWESDSGNLADLDQAQRSESVETKSASGCFDMGASNVSGFLPATSGSLTDTHSSSAAVMISAGTRVSQQTFKFKDNRTGAVDIPAKHSGFLLTRVVTAAGGGGFQLQTTKVGSAGTANGITSEAGAGSADSGQQPV